MHTIQTDGYGTYEAIAPQYTHHLTDEIVVDRPPVLFCTKNNTNNNNITDNEKNIEIKSCIGGQSQTRASSFILSQIASVIVIF